MKKNVFVFGLVLGTILCINMFYMVNLCYTNPEFKSNDLLGYAYLVLVFSLVFFGIRNYRNKQLKGSITFGKALKIGTLITLVASTMYVLLWIFYYYLFVPDFLDHYIQHVLYNTPESEQAARAQEMENFREMYKSPFFVIATTFAEVFPIGFVVALLSAAFLKKKNKTADTI